MLAPDAPATEFSQARGAIGARRAALAQKLGALEHKLENTVLGTTEAVTGAMATVKETVATTLRDVRETTAVVASTFDVPAHVRRNPWLAVGGAALLGFVVGSLFARSRA